MKVLITGGAGYIGSVVNSCLKKLKIETVIFDNFSNGSKNITDKSRYIDGDLLDILSISKVFQNEKFDAVLHFAGKTIPSESIKYPYYYFNNNVLGGINLLEAMRLGNCKKIIFSSSCSVYGMAKKLPVTEDDDLAPISVYGETKKSFESILLWYSNVHKINYVSLRYFNAAGATEDGEFGENHKHETHIIPLAIYAALGKNKSFLLYGNNYETPDGSCIRDYIHVLDLANVHILALEKIIKKNENYIYNVGSDSPYSNKEVIKMVKKISGKDFIVEEKPKRKGDPAIIYANSAKAKNELGWILRYSDLETIVSTAWNWHKNKVYNY